MSVGGTVHNELKSQAHKILLERDFNESDIEYEYKVKIGKKTYIVDVVGLENGEPHTAIECGSVSNKDKLIQLKALFEVVEHIPYVDSAIVTKMNEYEHNIRILERRLSEKEKIIKHKKVEPTHENIEPKKIDVDINKNQLELEYEKWSEKAIEEYKIYRNCSGDESRKHWDLYKKYSDKVSEIKSELWDKTFNHMDEMTDILKQLNVRKEKTAQVIVAFMEKMPPELQGKIDLIYNYDVSIDDDKFTSFINEISLIPISYGGGS